MSEDSEALSISFKTAEVFRQLIKDFLGQMTKGRVADIMRKARRFDRIWIDPPKTFAQFWLRFV
jgi:hypothetical protein